MNFLYIVACSLLLLSKASENSSCHGPKVFEAPHAEDLGNKAEMTEFFTSCVRKGRISPLTIAKQFSDEEGLYKAIMELIPGSQKQEELAKVLVLPGTDDSDAKYFRILAGQDVFEKLPKHVKRYIACHWFHDPKHGNSRLAGFLTNYHHSFDLFKKSLVDLTHIECRITCQGKYGGDRIAAAIISIILGLKGSLEDAERIELLKNLSSLFPKSIVVKEACQLDSTLSPDSSIAEIEAACGQSDALKASLYYAISTTSPELQTAKHFYRLLGAAEEARRGELSIDCSLLLNDRFVARHQIGEDDRSKLLEMCCASSILDAALWRQDLPSLNTKLLVNINPQENIEHKQFGPLVTMYCFDGTGMVWEKYKSQFCDLREHHINDIVLGIHYGKFLTIQQKVELLTAIRKKRLASLVSTYQNDRLGLLFAYFDSQRLFGRELIIPALLDNEFCSLFTNVLENRDHHHLVRLFIFEGRRHLVAKCIVDYVGDDVDKLKDLNTTDVQVLSLIFLLADHENIVQFVKERLILHKNLKYFSGSRIGRELVARVISRSDQLDEMKKALQRPN